MLALAAIGGYLLGAIPFGLLLTRAAGLGDVRAIGSGNIGATNVLRTGRKDIAAATLILDALKAVNLPAVEVHISDVSQREDFRQVSYAGMACVQTYMGLGLEGYRKAILFLKDYLQHR